MPRIRVSASALGLPPPAPLCSEALEFQELLHRLTPANKRKLADFCEALAAADGEPLLARMAEQIRELARLEEVTV